jgi:L-fuconolactonase
VIVDAHVHVFRPADVSPPGVDALAPAQRDAPVEDLLAVMAEHRVGAAVLVPLDEHDDYVRDVLRAHPRQFAAVAVADPAVQGRGDADPLDRLKQRRDVFGFHALRTQWLGTRDVPSASRRSSRCCGSWPTRDSACGRIWCPTSCRWLTSSPASCRR